MKLYTTGILVKPEVLTLLFWLKQQSTQPTMEKLLIVAEYGVEKKMPQREYSK